MSDSQDSGQINPPSVSDQPYRDPRFEITQAQIERIWQRIQSKLNEGKPDTGKTDSGHSPDHK